MIECLRCPLEDEAVPLSGRQHIGEIQEVRGDIVGAGGHHELITRRGHTLDHRDGIRVAVVEFIRVVVTHRNHGRARIGRLQVLQQLRHRLSLRGAFGAHTVTLDSKRLHINEGTQVVDHHDHRPRVRAGGIHRGVQHKRRTIVQKRGAATGRRKRPRGFGGHRVDPHTRRFDEETHVLRGRRHTIGEETANQSCFVTGIGFTGGDRITVDLIGQGLQCGFIEDLDVADDVGRPHQLADGECGLLPTCLVAGEVFDVESRDGELVPIRHRHGRAGHVGGCRVPGFRQHLVGIKREVEWPHHPAERDIRRHEGTRRSQQTVGVNEQTFGIAIKSRDAAVNHTGDGIHRHGIRQRNAGFTHRPRHTGKDGGDFTEVIGWCHRDQRGGFKAHAFESFELIRCAGRIQHAGGHRDCDGERIAARLHHHIPRQ